MKIVFTGGGTGGHFYPIIAVVEELNRIVDKEGVAGLELYYISDDPIDKDLLTKNRLHYIEIKSGKQRTYASIKNFTDKFLTLFACIKALGKLFILYPDVVFGKGGYASFPTIFAARILRIPVVIHESDIIPGKVNKWISGYADKIAVSYPEAGDKFPYKERVALTGNPIRRELLPHEDGNELDSFTTFQFDPTLPTILIIGGSQGSERINEAIVDILPRLVEGYQVIHQCGVATYPWIKKRVEAVLKDSINQKRYRLYTFLDIETLRHAYNVSTLIISRAGSSIFEIAVWGKPSILIPLPIARADHQRKNAYSYARTHATMVVEEANIHPELFFTTIHNLLNSSTELAAMKEGTKVFAHRDAGAKIAAVLLQIVLSHKD